MYRAKVDTNGRITIPAELREKLKLQPGRKVKFEETKDGIILIPLLTPVEIKANIGFLKVKGKSLLKEKRRERKLQETCLIDEGNFLFSNGRKYFSFIKGTECQNLRP